MSRISLRGCKCLRCGHEWLPKIAKPKWCPRCNSPYWNRERIKK